MDDRLSRKEKFGLVLLLIVALAFGGLVVKRAAFMKRRMTDVDCYLRAAWAVRTGQDLYEILDPNDWHYNYPPLFAILMTPLADPPPGADRTGMLPFAVSVAIWYAVSLGCLGLGVHWLAGAIEEKWPDKQVREQPRFCRRSWALRIIPILACLLPIGHTLMRGQVNLLLLALLCGMVAATLRGKSLLAGAYLAGAICLKVIPAFLLLFPLWRRDLRCLVGCALGLVVGGVVIPTMVFGPVRTVNYYENYARVLIGPALGLGADQSRAKEMIETTANDSQSLQAALHNTLHPIRADRPAVPTALVRWIPRVVGGFLTLLTLVASGWKKSDSGSNVALFSGALIINMLLLSPICHMHYFSLCVVIVMGLLAARWERSRHGLGTGLTLIFTLNILCYIPPNIPEWLILRDWAIMVYPTLILWTVGVVTLWKRSDSVSTSLDSTKLGEGASNLQGPPLAA
ncbi:MAG TPA: glycosyltransferase family 87 protein [Gemmataceae bacterium]|nr:glycosyltransferase family 87 protein [Gemmataceae bacterium]